MMNISENSRKLYVADLANDVHCNFPPEALMNTVPSYEVTYWLERISYNFLICWIQGAKTKSYWEGCLDICDALQVILRPQSKFFSQNKTRNSQLVSNGTLRYDLSIRNFPWEMLSFCQIIKTRFNVIMPSQYFKWFDFDATTSNSQNFTNW